MIKTIILMITTIVMMMIITIVINVSGTTLKSLDISALFLPAG